MRPSPAATTRTAAMRSSGSTSLSRNPLAPARSASQTYSLTSKVVSTRTATGRAAQLQAAQDAFTALAVRRERARIAHELHDVVPHRLAVIVMQAGAGRLAGAGDVALAAKRFRHVRGAGARRWRRWPG